MEDQFHGPEDQDNLEPQTPRKKRRGADFLSQYLLRRREQAGEGIETDDDEETEEKPKKFRRFFKGIFKNIVEQPGAPSEHPDRAKGFKLESLFGRATEEESAHDEEAPGLTEPLPEVTSATLPEAPEVPPPMLEIPERPRLDPIKPRFEPVIPDLYPKPQTAPEQAPQPVEKEVVIERGTGMVLPVALVGLEYLARKKADRKLDSKFTEKVTRVEQENKRNAEAKHELEKLVKQNRDQLESLKRERSAQPSKVEVSKSRIEMPIAPERAINIPEAKRVLAPVEQRQELEKPPEFETSTLLKEVAKAAESNVPVERVFERSHEVKDDKNAAVGAASIGSIVAARAAQQSIPSDGVSNAASSVGGLPIIGDSARGSLYSQAVKNGFWAAIAIIVLGVIAYLLK